MVEWAGLEIRSLSQDRGFESLSLLETKSGAVRPRFLFCKAPFLYPLSRLKKGTFLSKGSSYTFEWVEKKDSSNDESFLYPQAVSNRCCGNENPESWATRR